MSAADVSAPPAPVAPAMESKDEDNATTLLFPPDLSSSEVEDRVCKRLGIMVKGASAPFVCGGSVRLDGPPQVTLLDGNEDEKRTVVAIQPPKELRDGKLPYYQYSRGEKREELFAAQASDLNELLDIMPKAPFGKGGETVYDPSVRDALQLKAEKFELSIPQAKLDGILSQVKRDLQLETDVVAEPYSLNVYQKGGKFARHKDTPRGDDMLGTLVLCLPSWFTGGKMTVSLGEERKEFFGGGRYSWEGRSPPKPKEIEWCAFFADVDHEIGTVEEGVRVTAAYLLRRGDRAPASSNLPTPLAGKEQADKIMETFLGGLKEERFLSDGGKIGFPCLHLYTNNEVFPGKKDSSQPLTAAQLSKLKGRDLVVANAAALAGLDIRLVPYLHHDYSLDGEGDYPLSKFPKKKRCPRRMDDDKIETFFGTGEPSFPSAAAELWILDFNQMAASAPAGQTEWNAEGYFGNEASFIDFYVKAALIIEVPPFSESRGTPVVPLPPPKKKRKAATTTTATKKKPSSLSLSVNTDASAAAPAPIVTPAAATAAAAGASQTSGQYDLKSAVNDRLDALRADGIKVTPEDVMALCEREAADMATRLANELSGTTAAASGSTGSSSLAGRKRSAAVLDDFFSPARGSTSSSAPNVAAKATAKAAAKPFNAEAVRKRLLKKTTSAVKKAAHNDKKKPYSTVSDALPDEAAARSLFGSISPASDTKAMIKWKLAGLEVSRWFQNDPTSTVPTYIHPVKFDGKVICMFGMKPKVYAWAGFDSVEAKFEKKTNLLTLKVRTFMAGSGMPYEDSVTPPSVKRLH